MASIKLKLFITGKTPRSELAVRNIRRICDECIQGECQIQIIDVLEQPEAAEESLILATPTLLKISPAPIQKVIGDLSDAEKVLAGLGIINLYTNESQG